MAELSGKHQIHLVALYHFIISGQAFYKHTKSNKLSETVFYHKTEDSTVVDRIRHVICLQLLIFHRYTAIEAGI